MTRYFERITEAIVAVLEKSVRTWLKQWNPDHAAEQIKRSLRDNGIPYARVTALLCAASLEVWHLQIALDISGSTFASDAFAIGAI